MTMAFLKLALLAGLGLVTLGTVPDKLRGSILAIGICVVGAVVLHFAVP
jgi:hypothetical protein